MSLCPFYSGCPSKSGENQVHCGSDHLGGGDACAWTSSPPVPLPPPRAPQSLGSLIIPLRGGCRASVSDAPARYSQHCSLSQPTGDAHRAGRRVPWARFCPWVLPGVL